MSDYAYEPNVHCLLKQVKKQNNNFFDLFSPSFTKVNTPLQEFIVQQQHEMRIDLIARDIYGDELSGPEIMNNIDILLYINDLDNPLNIKKGMVLFYPEQDQLSNHRVTDSYVSETSKDKNRQVNKLAVPNKTSTKDPAREAFKANNFLLPPTAQPIPKEPVRITSDGKFSFGGI